MKSIRFINYTEYNKLTKGLPNLTHLLVDKIEGGFLSLATLEYVDSDLYNDPFYIEITELYIKVSHLWYSKDDVSSIIEFMKLDHISNNISISINKDANYRKYVMGLLNLIDKEDSVGIYNYFNNISKELNVDNRLYNYIVLRYPGQEITELSLSVIVDDHKYLIGFKCNNNEIHAYNISNNSDHENISYVLGLVELKFIYDGIRR